MGGRTNKPYARPSKANPDAPGSWKHDLHQSPSLADRLSGSGSSRGSSSSRPSLLSRISGGQGKELIPQNQKGGNKGKELFGFGTTPPINPSHINAGVELLGPPSKTSQGVVRTPRGFQAQDGNRSLAQSGINAALGQAFGREKREQRRVQERVQEVSILGAGRQSIVVRVANLAQGTTAEDVVSAFAPIQFLNATASPTSNLVSVDLELTSMKDANELIDKYNGQIADGNKLSVSIVKQQQGLASRMGAPVQQEKGRELIVPSSGKMYSDTILRSDPHARIQTVAEAEAEAREERNRQRADVWQKTGGGFQRNGASLNGGGRNGGGGGGGGRNGGGGGGGSLASRLSGGGRGRGGSGMMID